MKLSIRKDKHGRLVPVVGGELLAGCLRIEMACDRSGTQVVLTMKGAEVTIEDETASR